jgi:hypothetical protein
VPVDILYCEGGKKITDIRVIAKILQGACKVQPVGSKYGFKETIQIAREFQPTLQIFGLRDRDFDFLPEAPTINHEPGDWSIKDNQNSVPIGWYWQRKEIENYLIAPEVVSKALGKKAPPLTAYRDALQASAENIYHYTAARIALSQSRIPRLLPLPNYWGEKQWGIVFPQDLAETACGEQMKEIIANYQSSQMPDVKDLLDKFKVWQGKCSPSGVFFDNQNYGTFFAGKDLLCGMADALAGFGLGSPSDFRERVIKGIENANEDVWQWLPEWQRLRELILG